MTQRQKPRLRFSERIEQMHEDESEESGQFFYLLRIFFLPSLLVLGIAVVVSLFTWLKESLSGRAPLFAGGLVIAMVAAVMVWRRSRS